MAVDPGKMTGWAVRDMSTLAVVFGQDEFMAFMHRTWRFLNEQRHVHIASERFVISSGTVRKARGDVNWSIETIGMLRWTVAHLTEHEHSFELQNANDAMKFATDARLRTIEWWTPGRGHANDAARHLLHLHARRWPALLPPGIVPD